MTHVAGGVLFVCQELREEVGPIRAVRARTLRALNRVRADLDDVARKLVLATGATHSICEAAGGNADVLWPHLVRDEIRRVALVARPPLGCACVRLDGEAPRRGRAGSNGCLARRGGGRLGLELVAEGHRVCVRVVL